MKIIENPLELNQEKWEQQLLEGGLYKVEQELRQEIEQLYGNVLEGLLNKVGTSIEFKNRLQEYHRSNEVGDFRIRETSVQVQNGNWVSYMSYYARQRTGGISGHLSRSYWAIESRSSYFSHFLINTFF